MTVFSRKTTIFHPPFPTSWVLKNPNDLMTRLGTVVLELITRNQSITFKTCCLLKLWLTNPTSSQNALAKDNIFTGRDLPSICQSLTGFWDTTLLPLLALRNFSWDKSSAVLSAFMTIAQLKFQLGELLKLFLHRTMASYGKTIFLLFLGLAFKHGPRTRSATQEPYSVVLTALARLVLAMAQKPVIVATLVENLSC